MPSNAVQMFQCPCQRWEELRVSRTGSRISAMSRIFRMMEMHAVIWGTCSCLTDLFGVPKGLWAWVSLEKSDVC